MAKRTKKTGNKSSGTGNGNGTGEYKVGYGKPPVHSQFQKGKSGYPRGKPKGRKNTKTMIRDIAFAPIAIQVQGKTQKITAYEAMLMKMRQAALNGDYRSTAHILQLGQSVDHDEGNEKPEVEAMPFDQRTFNALLRDYLKHNGDDDAGDGKDAGAAEDGEDA